MALTKLEYTKVWTDPDDFPTIETDETQVREDIQLLYDEAKNALNGLIDELESTEEDASGADQIGCTPVGASESTTVQGNLEYLMERIGQSLAGVYFCTYGSTTYAEIGSALDDGLLPVVVHEGDVRVLGSYQIGAAYFFGLGSLDSTDFIACSSQNVWSTGYLNLVDDTTFQTNKEIWDAKQDPPEKLTLTLDADSWSSLSQTITATGVTASNLVEVAPASAADAKNWSDNAVWCSAQGADSLTFVCEGVPDDDISVNVVIW